MRNRGLQSLQHSPAMQCILTHIPSKPTIYRNPKRYFGIQYSPHIHQDLYSFKSLAKSLSMRHIIREYRSAQPLRIFFFAFLVTSTSVLNLQIAYHTPILILLPELNNLQQQDQRSPLA